MAWRESVVDSVLAAYRRWNSTLENDLFADFVRNGHMDGHLVMDGHWYSLSPRILVKAETLDSLLCQVKKNDMLRCAFPRIIEGLMQPIQIRFNPLLPSIRDSIRVKLFAYDFKECLESLDSLIALFLDDLTSRLGFVDNALVSAIVLSIVFQYLVGYVDKGGTKTYNPGSLEFRATYVSLLLFLGAYIWIKFREVAERTVRRRHKKDKSGKVLKDEFGQVQYYDKWEPRFKPSRERGIPKHDYLPLGGYDTHRDAEVVCQIAGFYYAKDEGAVALADGSHFFIPEMSEQECSLCGEEKRKWVSAKAREVFKSFKVMAAREQPRLGAHPGDQVDVSCSPSADQATRLSAHAADQVGGPGSPSADQFAIVAFPITNGNDEFVERLSTLAGEHGPLGSIGDGGILFDFDIPMLSIEGELNEQLHLQKKQLEADFNRRIERLTEQHEERYRSLEVEKSELRQENLELREENLEVRQENKRLKIITQHAAETLLRNL